MTIEQLARRFDAYVPTDNAFQRKARILQSIWREEHGFPSGTHEDNPLGSRLRMPEAKEMLSNYLSEEIRQVVREEVMDGARSKGKVYQQPRIFDNLLSSQPLAFNLFGPLRQDWDLARHVLSDWVQPDIQRVIRFEFEHSPGRADPRYTGDKSAFDVYVEFLAADGSRGFLGIEVKYHEDLSDSPAERRARYEEVADSMGCFLPDRREELRVRPLQQIWHTHLLAGALREADGFTHGLFGVVHPDGNTACVDALQHYVRCLRTCETFCPATLEQLVRNIEQKTKASWIADFRDRYLDFGKLERYQR